MSLASKMAPSPANGLVRKAAVIGAGIMGGGIAAQFANAGIPVVLLDVASKEGGNRSAAAEAGVARQIRTGGFMLPQMAANVTTGNLEDDLSLIADADWTVEAIVEDLGAKQALYRRLEGVRKPGSIVSSNTSTLRREQLVGDLGRRFDSDFLVTHFFNPPRQMRLLELVAGRHTPAATVERVRAIADQVLGKTVIDCRDTPGFIANRLGCFWLSAAVIEAVRLGMTVEEADAVLGRPLGMPATGVFGLLDLIGLDLVPKVWGSLYAGLDSRDAFQGYDLPGEPLTARMISEGRIGRKAGGGFYRRTGNGAERTEQAIDIATMAYRARVPGAPKGAGPLRPEDVLFGDTRQAGYGWRVLSQVICYSADIAEEIADDVASIDVAMQLGYSWKEGPFALADRIGVNRIVERLRAEERPVPPLLAKAGEAGGFHPGRRTVAGASGSVRAGGLTLPESGTNALPALQNDSAAVWDIGEGIACVDFRTKSNALDMGVIDFLHELREWLPARFRGLVIGNGQSRFFSVGADLAYFVTLAERGTRTEIESFISRGQSAFLGLKYAPFPVVAAISGMAVGGGCELQLHCDAAVAAAETVISLPEATLGLLPAWGGCTQMMVRSVADPASGGFAAAASRTFATLRQGTAARSAPEAVMHHYLRPTDTIVMNPDRVLAEARGIAASLAGSYAPPPRALLTLAGPSGRAALVNTLRSDHAAGRLGDYDLLVGRALANVLTGGGSDPLVPVSEEAVMTLEREANLSLLEHSQTRERMRHMLETGKPLRN